MAQKRIFVLDGHPADKSLSRTIAVTYAQAARDAGHEVHVAHVSEMNFDLDFGGGGYKSPKPLEPVLEEVLSNIEWSEHVVVATPMWWGGLPAKLKGLFDRSLLPGRTFDTRGKLPKPMLKGRTARVFLTSDTPAWYFRLFYRNALKWQLKKQILGFIGLKTKITAFSGATQATEKHVQTWSRRVKGFAAQAQ